MNADTIYIGLGLAVLAAWAASVHIEGQRVITAALRLALPAILLWVIFGRGGSFAAALALFALFLAGPLLLGTYLFAWVRSRTAARVYFGTLAMASVAVGAASLLHFRVR